jgi:hypothetical protein
MQQQFTGSMPLYQFQQTSYNTTPLQQTIKRAPSTSNNNSPQNEPEKRTNYTWQLVEKRVDVTEQQKQ